MSRALPFVLLAGAALVWSGNVVFSRGLHAVVPPVGLSFWRWTVALAVLLPLAGPALWRQRAGVRPALPLLGLLALSGITGYSTLLYLGLQTTGAINAVLITATVPALIVLLGWAGFRERPRGVQLLGIAVSLLGVGWIVTRGDPARVGVLGAPGDLWILGAALSWALYSAWLRRRPAGLDPLAFLLVLVLLGWPPLLVLYLLEIAGGRLVEFNLPTVAIVLYVGILASIVAYVAWNHGVGRIGAARAGVFMHLMPVFSTLLAIGFLGERPQLFHAVGVVLIAAGLVLASRSPPAADV